MCDETLPQATVGVDPNWKHQQYSELKSVGYQVSRADMLEKQAHMFKERAELAEKAAKFFKSHPEFEEFMMLQRTGAFDY